MRTRHPSHCLQTAHLSVCGPLLGRKGTALAPLTSPPPVAPPAVLLFKRPHCRVCPLAVDHAAEVASGGIPATSETMMIMHSGDAVSAAEGTARGAFLTSGSLAARLPCQHLSTAHSGVYSCEVRPHTYSRGLAACRGVGKGAVSARCKQASDRAGTVQAGRQARVLN